MHAKLLASTLLALTLPTLAQQPASTGTVTGHVTFADTHLPARIASVVLQPIVDLNSPALKPDSKQWKPEGSTTIIQTYLDGSFTIPNVRPGEYYVIAEKLGYLSPLSQLSRDDLNHPTKETASLMAALLTPVSVAANRTATAEVTLLKGATIAGTVRFDDGTPDSSAGVSLLHKDKSGKWVSFRTKLLAVSSWGPQTTDDQGHFRISGLPAGEYLLKTDLQLEDITLNHVFSEFGGMSTIPRYTLTIYSGNTTRQRDATAIKVAEGQESNLNDIEIPLSKLHAVSGSLLEANGRTVNAGHLSIQYTADDAEVASTNVSKDDNSFHFLYVPEGEYTVKVTEARDVTRTEIPNCSDSDCSPPSHTEEKILRTFGPTDQPLILHADVSGLTITVPPPTPANTANLH